MYLDDDDEFVVVVVVVVMMELAAVPLFSLRGARISGQSILPRVRFTSTLYLIDYYHCKFTCSAVQCTVVL